MLLMLIQDSTCTIDRVTVNAFASGTLRDLAPCAVAVSNRRTPYWVVLCADSGELLSAERARLTCEPLPHALPLPGMGDVKYECAVCQTATMFILQLFSFPRSPAILILLRLCQVIRSKPARQNDWLLRNWHSEARLLPCPGQNNSQSIYKEPMCTVSTNDCLAASNDIVGNMC